MYLQLIVVATLKFQVMMMP